MLEPIKTDKLYKIIMERISALIDARKLEPGSKLPSERELASALSVSRASVRQAIAALSVKGLLVIRQGDGTYVSDIGEEKNYMLESLGNYLAKKQIVPDDILESRVLVECEAARLCASRATDEQLVKIREIHLSKVNADSNETGEDTQLNRELHYTIAEGAQNQVLLMFMEVLWNTMSSNMWPLLKRETMVRYEQKRSHDLQHEAIINAICTRDEEGAYEAMYKHLTSIRDDMTKVMEKPIDFSIETV